MPCAPPRFLPLARTLRYASVRQSVRHSGNPVRDVGGPPLSGHAVRSHWLDGGTASRHRPFAGARRRRPTAHAAPCTALPHLGTQVTFLTNMKLSYKKVDAVRHSRCRATEPPLPPPSVLTTSSTLRPLPPPTRAAPACP
jgi:hypothetical protein